MARVAGAAITTTAVTANQTILTDTPGAAESLKCIVLSGFLTVYSATESNLGTVTISTGGVARQEIRIQNTDLDSVSGTVVIPLGNGLTFNGSTAVLVSVTPAAATSMRWSASLWYQ
jgi:hypothetical protein